MKKISIIFIALSLTLLFLGCGNKNEEHRYSSTASDRDTIESFGADGQFAIYKVLYKNKKGLDLFDSKNNTSIDVITDYKEIKPYVYTKGEKGYTKLNYEDGAIIQSDNLDGFSDEDKKIFNNLK